MFHVKHNKELEAQLRWQRHGKKWKAKYFEALKDLLGDKKSDRKKVSDSEKKDSA